MLYTELAKKNTFGSFIVILTIIVISSTSFAKDIPESTMFNESDDWYYDLFPSYIYQESENNSENFSAWVVGSSPLGAVALISNYNQDKEDKEDKEDKGSCDVVIYNVESYKPVEVLPKLSGCATNDDVRPIVPWASQRLFILKNEQYLRSVFKKYGILNNLNNSYQINQTIVNDGKAWQANSVDECFGFKSQDRDICLFDDSKKSLTIGLFAPNDLMICAIGMRPDNIDIVSCAPK